MDFGVSTSCLYPMYTEEALSFLAKNGVKNVEIFFNADEELEGTFIGLLHKITRKYGVNVKSLHVCAAHNDSFMLFSNYDRRLKQGLDNYKKYGEIAHILGAKYVVMHGGKDNGILDLNGYCERYLLINEQLIGSGAYLLQENATKFRCGDLNFLKNMCDILGNRLKICFDVKQAIRHGYNPMRFYNEVKENICHIHLSDNTSMHDCLLPGRGSFNIKRFLNMLSENNFGEGIIIEVYNKCYTDYNEIINGYNYLRNLK